MVLVATNIDQGPFDATKNPIIVNTIIFPAFAVPWIFRNSDIPDGKTPINNSINFANETLNWEATNPTSVTIGKIDRKRENAIWPGKTSIVGFCVIKYIFFIWEYNIINHKNSRNLLTKRL